jgi:hypothetical protein
VKLRSIVKARPQVAHRQRKKVANRYACRKSKGRSRCVRSLTGSPDDIGISRIIKELDES